MTSKHLRSNFIACFVDFLTFVTSTLLLKITFLKFKSQIFAEFYNMGYLQTAILDFCYKT